jgi:glycosyltransferase involved in cell wall biosynthesis
MKALIVASHNRGSFSAFVTEQAEDTRKLGVEIEYYGIVGNGLIGYLKNRGKLLRKIKEFSPDIIHAHYGLSGALAVLQRKTPVVTTFHNGETLSKLTNLLSSFASLFATYRIYVAQHIYDLCYFTKKTNYTILPCGVDINFDILDNALARKELGFEHDKKYILFGGAFSNLRKNYPLLKQAVELLQPKGIEVIEMRGLNREQITKLMCACDVFALPTKSEGSPQALKEAMACNCPIVATDIADIKFLLGNIKGHYICSFEAKDVADKLQSAFAIKSRTEGRKRIIELGLDAETVAEKVVSIYQKVLSK